jgi:hypothetical protein
MPWRKLDSFNPRKAPKGAGAPDKRWNRESATSLKAGIIAAAVVISTLY